MTLWYDEVFEDRARFGLKVSQVLHSGRSELQSIEVVQTDVLGRALVLDGVFQTSERDEFFYHEMMAHPALATAPCIERVLIVGGGDGGTAREALRHGDVKSVVMVEIDRAVVETCKEYLPRLGGGAWNDPRLQLVFDDGAEYVRRAESDGRLFDVVLIDSSDPVGPAEVLLGEPFLAGCRRILEPGGVLVAQSGTPVYYEKEFVSLVRSLRSVFGNAHPYCGSVPLYASGLWTWTYASDSTSPQAIVPERLLSVLDGCQYYNEAIHRAAFALPSFMARKLRD